MIKIAGRERTREGGGDASPPVNIECSFLRLQNKRLWYIIKTNRLTEEYLDRSHAKAAAISHLAAKQCLESKRCPQQRR